MTEPELVHTTTSALTCPFCHSRRVETLAEGYYNCPDCDTEFDEDEL